METPAKGQRSYSCLEKEEANRRQELGGESNPTGQRASACKRLLKWRSYLIIILAPIVLSPIPIAIPTSEARCAYCILVMAIYWVTEVVDLAVTALLPLVLFPLFGVLGSKQVSTPYFKDTNVLFLGGLIVAVAVEQWNLHKRIALRVLLLVGAQPRRLMLGFMLTTAFLSMWISNTATTAMMVPIVEAVLGELKDRRVRNKVQKGEDNNAGTDNQAVGIPMEDVNENPNNDATTEEKAEAIEPVTETDVGLRFKKNEGVSSVNLVQDVEQSAEDLHHMQMCKAMMLAIAYAANIGGTATLTGTAPNLVFSGQVHSLYPDSPGVSFASWFGYAFPEMVILLFIAWIWIQLLYMKISCRCCGHRSKVKDKEKTRRVKQILLEQYKSLGPMSFAEGAVLGHFVLLAVLWLFRDPKFMPGWGSLFKKDFVRDATCAMFISFSLFIFPSEKPKIFCWNPDGKVTKPPPALLEWKTMARRFPWNIVILLGSGFALAEACKVSGLSKWVGVQLSSLDAIPSWAIVAVVCIMITTFTEVTSNTATATIFLPILASLGETINVHPWYLMLPATISCSFAFMLPVATPPNAIVFSGGHLKVRDMAKAGIGMNIIAVTILLVCVNVYGVAMFDLDTFPDWVCRNNGTAC